MYLFSHMNAPIAVMVSKWVGLMGAQQIVGETFA